MLKSLWNDEAGFIVSAELVLIATIAVLALIVGLGELSFSMNNELEDVASAYGAVNQSFSFTGVNGHFGSVGGSTFVDHSDFCDVETNIGANTDVAGEAVQ